MSTVTGLIDGTGSAGSALGQLFVPIIQNGLGWNWVFYLFILMVRHYTIFLIIIPKIFAEYSVRLVPFTPIPPRLSTDLGEGKRKRKWPAGEWAIVEWWRRRSGLNQRMTSQIHSLTPIIFTLFANIHITQKW